MGVGGFFPLLAAAIAVALIVLAVTGNLTWLGWRDLEQNLQDRPRGEPADRRD